MLLQSANALSFDDIQAQTYLQVKGTGSANTCPTLDEGASDGSALKQGNYALSQFCMEPTKFTVKEESQFKGGTTEFVPTKLMTRLTYTLDQVPDPSPNLHAIAWLHRHATATPACLRWLRAELCSARFAVESVLQSSNLISELSSRGDTVRT